MGKCERILTLEEDEAKDGEEVDEDEREDEGEDDGPKVARDSADHILQRLLPEDHLHQLNNVCFMITVEAFRRHKDGNLPGRHRRKGEGCVRQHKRS